LLRDYHDRAAQSLNGLRNELSSTAQALREMVEGLSQCDGEHHDKLRSALARLRDVAGSPEGRLVRTGVRAVADNIEQSLEQMRSSTSSPSHSCKPNCGSCTIASTLWRRRRRPMS
jgi:hypothetical protein